MNKYECSIVGCEDSSLVRHKFPKIREGQPSNALLEWVRRCGNPNLRWQDTKGKVVCHKHFHANAINECNRVKKGHVPVLFLPECVSASNIPNVTIKIEPLKEDATKINGAEPKKQVTEPKQFSDAKLTTKDDSQVKNVITYENIDKNVDTCPKPDIATFLEFINNSDATINVINNKEFINKLNGIDNVPKFQPVIKNNTNKPGVCRICLTATKGNTFSITSLQNQIKCLYAPFHVSLTAAPICCQDCKDKINSACETIQLIKNNDLLLCSRAKNSEGFVQLDFIETESKKEDQIFILIENDNSKLDDILNHVRTDNSDNTDFTTDFDNNANVEIDPIEKEFDWETYNYGNNIDQLPDYWYDQFPKKQPPKQIDINTIPNPEHDYASSKEVTDTIKLIGYQPSKRHGPIPMPHLKNGIFSEAFDNYLEQCRGYFGKVMQRHIRSYSKLYYNDLGDGPYLCHKCGYSSSSKSTFRVHLQKYHSREGPGLCPHCGRTFIDLTCHIHMVHTKRKRFKCSKCPKTFKHKVSLNMHMNLHKDLSEREIFSCEFCGQEFTTKRYRDIHIVRHTSEKKFHCQYCDSKFWHRHSLKRHIRRHDYQGEPVSCPTCNHNFKNPTCLQKHIDVVHTKTGEYKCQHCEKCFYKSDTLNRHLINIHNVDIKRYRCDICRKLYFSEVGFKAHMFTKHCINTSMIPKNKEEEEGPICEHCSKKFGSWDELIEHRVDEHTELFLDSDNDNNDVEDTENENMDTADDDSEPEFDDLVNIQPSVPPISPKSIKLLKNLPINMPFI